MALTAEQWITKLNLSPHPEGGHYRQTYRAHEGITGEHLPSRFGSARRYATAIYYLLAEPEVSKFHRLKADEIWHFYAGNPLALHVIDGEQLKTTRLGPNFDHGEVFQLVVAAGCWFGAEVIAPNSYALVGCTVAPGFEFEDFELGIGEELARQCPAYRDLIIRLT
jgi:uncharacterized protein